MPQPEELICPKCDGPKSRQARQCARCSRANNGVGGHTPDERDQHALCGAKKRNGELCRAFAGQGTEHPGIGKCRFHGGNSPSHKTHAIDVEARRQMITLGEAIEMEPHESLLLMHHKCVGHVAWTALRIERMTEEELASREGQIILKLYDNERDRLTRIAEVCLRAGVSEARLQIEEAEAALIAKFMDSILEDLRLSPGQKKALDAAIDKALPIITSRELSEAEIKAANREIADALNSYVPSEWTNDRTRPSVAGQRSHPPTPNPGSGPAPAPRG